MRGRHWGKLKGDKEGVYHRAVKMIINMQQTQRHWSLTITQQELHDGADDCCLTYAEICKKSKE